MGSFTADGSFHLEILMKLRIKIKPPAIKLKAIFGSQNLKSVTRERALQRMNPNNSHCFHSNARTGPRLRSRVDVKNREKGRHKGSQNFGTPLSGGSERFRPVQVFDTWEET